MYINGHTESVFIETKIILFIPLCCRTVHLETASQKNSYGDIWTPLEAWEVCTTYVVICSGDYLRNRWWVDYFTVYYMSINVCVCIYVWGGDLGLVTICIVRCWKCSDYICKNVKKIHRLWQVYVINRGVASFLYPHHKMWGAILDSLCRVGRSVGPSVRLQFVSAL